MKKLFMFAAFAAAAMFAACDDDDTSNDTKAYFYQSLSAEYNVTTNQTYAAANFNRSNANGESIILAGNQSLLINGQLPVYANVSPYYYTLTLPGLDKLTFVFTRDVGEVYTNTVSVDQVKPVTIPADFVTVKSTGTTTLTWTGDPVGDKETIMVRLMDGNQKVIGTFYQRELNATTINIVFTSAVPAPGSAGLLLLTRVKELPLAQTNGDAGGLMKVNYTVQKEVTFE